MRTSSRPRPGILLPALSAILLLLPIPSSTGAGRNLKVPKYPVSGPQGGISLTITLPEGFDQARDTCPIVIFMHGIFSSKDFPPMPSIARSLASRGYASLRFDFGGHGRSEGRKVDMTIGKELEEARAVWDYARGLPFVSSLYLLGHSQGGVVASMLSGMLSQEGEAVPKGLVLLAPGAVIRDATRTGSFFGKEFDPEDPPRFIRCFNIYKLGRDYLTQTQELDIYGTSSPYGGPVLLVHGSRDGIVPLWCSERYLEAYGPDRAELKVVEGERHTFTSRTAHVCGLVAEFLLSVEAGRTPPAEQTTPARDPTFLSQSGPKAVPLCDNTMNGDVF